MMGLPERLKWETAAPGVVIALLVILSGCSSVGSNISRSIQQPMPADESTFIEVIRGLERSTLDIVSVAELKAVGEEAPSFESLKPELLKYNTENGIKRWEAIYNNEPGWIMEPVGLVFASSHSMYEASFQAEEQPDNSVRLQFRTYGNPLNPRSDQVVYTLVPAENGMWKIDLLNVKELLYGFTLDEVKEIVADEAEGAEYVDEDDDFYYFHAEKQQDGMRDYMFHKKNGYLEYWSRIE